MKRGSKTVPVLTTLYNNFMEDYLDILEKMEKLEELKFNERKLVRDRELHKINRETYVASLR